MFLHPFQDALTLAVATIDVYRYAEVLLFIHMICMLLQARQKRPKNRLPMKSEGSQRRSAFSIRLFLREFCVEFLNGAYNTLMYHVKVSCFMYLYILRLVCNLDHQIRGLVKNE